MSTVFEMHVLLSAGRAALSECSQQTAALVSFMWMSKELKQSLETWATEGRRGNLCDTVPVQSSHSQQIEIWVRCLGNASDIQKAYSVVSLCGNWSPFVPHSYVFGRKRLHSPKPSDSNKHVSPTPTSRHQARKLAVLSRAKKEPEGADRRHGILRYGIVC